MIKWIKKNLYRCCECKKKYIFELQENGLNGCVRVQFNAISIAFNK